MRKSFVLIYSPTLAIHKQITDLLDELDPTGDWHTSISNSLFFTSELTAQQLAEKFEGKFGTGAGKHFLIMEASSNKQGRLLKRGWRVLNNPDNPRGTTG